MVSDLRVLYVCRQCWSMATQPGPCPRDGLTRLECQPGDPDSPCRRPPMDAEGRILNRAPLWWVLKCAPYLKDHVQT
jgi:hypothetical protein